MTCQDVQDLIPAYVLDALDEVDRARVKAHLPQCPDCTRAVKDYQPVVDRLPYAALQIEPRAELKYRVLAATLPRRRSGFVPANPSLQSRIGMLLGSLVRAPVLAAAALLIVLGLTFWILQSQNQMSTELTHQREFLTMMAYTDSPPRHLLGTQAAASAAGRMYGDPEESTFVIVTYEMPKLPSSQVYQIWLIDASGTRTSGGTFTVDEEGRGWLLGHAPKPLSAYQGVGVTIEPVGGSPNPTGTRLLGGDL